MKQIILPDFIIVPYQLISDDEITLIDERLYGIIYWFAKLKLEKCTASNATLAKLVKTTPKTIQNSLIILEEKGYIERKYKDSVSHHREEIIPLVVFQKINKSTLPPEGGTLPPTDGEGVPLTGGSPLPPTDDQNKKEDKKEREKNILCEQSSRDIESVIKMFEIVNPSYERLYQNKTQRFAAARLLKKWTLEQIRAVVGILPKLNADKYAKGKSLSPLQLEENLGYIKAYIDQHNSKRIKRYEEPNE